MAALARRLRNISTPVPDPSTWTNITDLPGVNTCISLFQGSTSDSHINDGLDAGNLLTSIQRRKTTLWLYNDPAHAHSVTIMFHAFQGVFFFIPRSPRYNVCAGIDQTIDPGVAYGILRTAVIQFASINNTTTDNLYVFQLNAFPFTPADRISQVFQLLFTNNEVQDPQAGMTDLIGAGGRWHGRQTTWEFIEL